MSSIAQMSSVTTETRTTAQGHPAVFDTDAGDWFVLHTRTHQERKLADALHAMDVAYFLPLKRSIRFHGARQSALLAPLFPNYLFMRGDIDQVYLADRTKRVCQVIPVHDQGRLENELRAIHLVLAEGGSLDPHPYLKVGMRVEVRSGPFRGIRGLVKQKTKESKLVLQVDVLGQATSLEIDGSLLEAVN